MKLRSLQRRGVLAGAVAAAVAGLSRFAATEQAEASHNVGGGGPANSDGSALHIGQTNDATGSTVLSGNAATTLTLLNTIPVGPGVGGTGLQVLTAKGYGILASSVNAEGVIASSSTSIGVRGTGTNNFGVWGEAQNGVGVRGVSQSGTGVVGTSNNAVGVNGSSTGSYGMFGVSTNNIGIYGTSANSYGIFGTSSASVGVYGSSGTNSGVVGQSSSGVGVFGISGSSFAGQFVGPVIVQGSLTVQGPKSAAVPHPDGSTRRVYCQESPEPWFEDFGVATLANGRTEIALDPDFDAVVKGDDYLVFLTPEGNCNGLFVSGKGPHKFVVEELNGGKSTLSFSYRVVSRRRDIAGARLERVQLPRIVRREDAPKPAPAPKVQDLPAVPPALDQAPRRPR